MTTKPTPRYTGSDPAVYRRIMDETRANVRDIRSRLNNMLLDDNKRYLLDRAELRILAAVSDILADIENRLRTDSDIETETKMTERAKRQYGPALAELRDQEA